MFKKFLNSLKTPQNASLIEAIEQGFKTLQNVGESKKIVYHGSNSKELEGGLKVPSGNYKEGFAWATDNFDYASQQGDWIHEMYIVGKNELTPTTLANVNKDDIYNIINQLHESKVSKDIFDTKLYPMILQRIEKYKAGEIPSERVFEAMYDVRVLKKLGFTHEIVANPYDKSGKTSFYKILSPDAIQEYRTYKN